MAGLKSLTVAVLLIALPAAAQVDVVAKYRANYPTPMSADQKVDLLRHVAVDVHGGLLQKPDGTNCGGYACDVICFSDAVLFDVLFDQDSAASPRWNPTSNPRNYHCELVAPGPPPPPAPAPIPTPAPVPVPAASWFTPEVLQAAVNQTLTAVTNSHDNLTQQFTEMRADVVATKADVDQLRADVKTSVGDVLAFIGKYIAPAGIALWAGTKVGK